MEIDFTALRRDTVQVIPDARKENNADLFGFTQRGYFLEPYGTRLREQQLRWISRNEFLWMTQGAFAGVGKRVASTPWQVKGPDDVSEDTKSYYRRRAKAANLALPGKQSEDIEYFQELIRQADFARGWASFAKKFSLDYLRQDGGCYIEIIAPGDPVKAPTGLPTGLAYLDSLRCVPTGDPEFPVYYYDRYRKLHRMHHTRVYQLLDMPDGDEDHPGYGLCALSRAISIANRQVLIGRYIETMLDDKPKPGIIVAKGMTKGIRDQMLNMYREDQAKDEMPPWGKTMWAFGMDRDAAPEMVMMAFSEAPEKFDFKVYTELDINSLALAIGVDVQELWQLTSAGLGSGQQSEILQQKSRGKLIGDLLTNIERMMNDILPEDYQFEFKKRDAQEETEAATNAQAWGSAVSSMSSTLSMEEQRVLLANTIDQYREAVTDERGEIQRRDDLDVQPPVDLTATDETPLPQTAQDTTPVATPQAEEKAYQSTLLDFEGAFEDLVAGALKGDIARSRFAIVSRALLKKYGRAAMLDGLKEGGIETDELDSDDMATFTVWIAQNSSYLSNFADRIYKTDTQMTPDARAQAWGQGSLREIYQKGLLSADANSMRIWTLGEAEHCPDCLRLANQSHRLKDWFARELYPGSEKLACSLGCKCKLVKTKGRGRGKY